MTTDYGRRYSDRGREKRVRGPDGSSGWVKKGPDNVTEGGFSEGTEVGEG